MDLIKSILSKNLLALRKAKRLKQSEVAESLGLNSQTYGRWENGTAWPDTASLEKLARFYHVRSTRFFHDPELEKGDAAESIVYQTPTAEEVAKKFSEVTKEFITFLGQKEHKKPNPNTSTIVEKINMLNPEERELIESLIDKSIDKLKSKKSIS